jgi:hypothetical protein
LVAASPLVMVAAGLGFFAARWRSPSTPFQDEGQRQQSAGRGNPEAEVATCRKAREGNHRALPGIVRRSPVCIEETGLQCVAHAPSHQGWELGQARARVSSERGRDPRCVTHVAEGQGHESSSEVLRTPALSFSCCFDAFTVCNNLGTSNAVLSACFSSSHPHHPAAQSRLEQAGLGFFAARWRSPSTPFRDEGQCQQSAGRGDPETEVATCRKAREGNHRALPGIDSFPKTRSWF